MQADGPMDAEQLFLPIDDMSKRHPGLSSGTALSYHEAARVCLDRHHRSPTSFWLETTDATTPAFVKWDEPDQHCLAAHANEIDATEWGAYCCALGATELLRGLVAIYRAPTGTGADYYLNDAGGQHEDLETSIRLEVSGTDKGTVAQIRARLLKKMNQAREGASNLPALAAVVGFKSSRVALSDLIT
jgi:hypothetical protein